MQSVDEIFDDKKRYVTFFGSARILKDNRYYKEALNLANMLSLKFIIITGGGPGIMEAANKGAKESLGFNVILPSEQSINKFVTKGITFDNLNDRKKALILKSEAFVIFPGGFGTMDEFFEVLTLSQTNLKKSKIYLFDSAFYNPLIEFFKISLIKNSTISKDDLNLFRVVDDIKDIAKELLD